MLTTREILERLDMVSQHELLYPPKYNIGEYYAALSSSEVLP
jgi:hypothetical protein